MSEGSEDISAPQGGSHCQFNILLNPQGKRRQSNHGLNEIGPNPDSTVELRTPGLGMREISDAKLVKLMITEFYASMRPTSVLTQMASEEFLSSFTLRWSHSCSAVHSICNYTCPN